MQLYCIINFFFPMQRSTSTVFEVGEAAASETELELDPVSATTPTVSEVFMHAIIIITNPLFASKLWCFHSINSSF